MAPRISSVPPSTAASADLPETSTTQGSFATATTLPRRKRQLITALAMAVILGSLLIASLALAQEDANPAQPVVIITDTHRNSHSATLLADGRVLIVGGWDGVSTLASAEVYEPRSQSWLPTGALGSARAFHAAVRLSDGQVLVSGGWDSLGHALTSTEIYAPSTSSWTAAAPLRGERAAQAAVALQDGRVLVAGGCTEAGVRRDAEVYDPKSDTWQAAGEMGEGRCGAAAVLLVDGRLLVIGGHDQQGQALASVERSVVLHF